MGSVNAVGFFSDINVPATNRRAALKARLRSAQAGAQAAEWAAEDELGSTAGDAAQARKWHALAARAQRRQRAIARQLARLKR